MWTSLWEPQPWHYAVVKKSPDSPDNFMELMVQLIMDCTADGILPPPPPSSYQLDKLESTARRYCYALHWLRKRLMKIVFRCYTSLFTPVCLLWWTLFLAAYHVNLYPVNLIFVLSWIVKPCAVDIEVASFYVFYWQLFAELYFPHPTLPYIID